ncbi:hypothetical protein C8Q72DRAFT_836482 [Fomitopsis betulina]|nr:hypothetical protein C8Q72DRAFT_836482 [Fomitopsis betulina]
MAYYAHLRSALSSSSWHIRLLSSQGHSVPSIATPSTIPWFTSIPSFRHQLARTNKLPSFRERVRCPSVRNQVLFAGITSFVLFSMAAGSTNDETFLWSVRLSLSAPTWRTRPPTNDEMRRARYYALGKTLQHQLVLIKEVIDDWPQTVKALAIWAYIQVAQPVLDNAETKRLCWAIGAVNGLLYLAWHFPRTKLFMRARFAHNPLSGLSHTMLTSLFSHRSLTHVVVNSMLLASFGMAASQHFFEVQTNGPDNLREATPRWHFFAFFISAGLFSNLISHVAFARITYPRLIARLRAAPVPAKSLSPARSFLAQVLRSKPPRAPAVDAGTPLFLGASGAVYACMTVCTFAYPDAALSLQMPPVFPVSIGVAMGSLVAFDIVSILQASSRFNHWAHLGGVVFGALYWAFGPPLWEFFREANLHGLPPSLTILPPEMNPNQDSGSTST